MLADPILTERAIINVQDNAAKYAITDSTIHSVALLDGAFPVISVADNGPGISSGAPDRVFDMFCRAESGDKQRAGTGLGLAICEGLVEAQGGFIRAEPVSADGKGMRIVIRLPLDANR